MTPSATTSILLKKGLGNHSTECENASSIFTEKDLYLFRQGNHHRIYKKLGAHPQTIGYQSGYHFAVWAPNAQRISVVGSFNHWDASAHPLHRVQQSGIWETFIPNLSPGHSYKYAVRNAQGKEILKADPYANAGEYNQGHASILCPSLLEYSWHDSDWIAQRSKQKHYEQPLSIYEMHLGSWKRDAHNQPLSYRALATELVPYLQATGFTHVEFMPLAEYPLADSWGYQVTGFFAPTSRYGSPQDLQFLIDTLHQAYIGVILDWVPGHFPKDEFGLSRWDGTALYEHADPRQGEQPDWGTLLFNYGRHEVRNFLLSNALFWIDLFHVDGLRMDAVSSMLYLNFSKNDGEWLPNVYGGKENLEAIALLRTTNDLIHHYYPGVITIAEESSSFDRVSQPTEYNGLGFDFKWNMGWMHDTLSYCQQDPLARSHHHQQMTFGRIYQYAEHFIQVFSHDEVVYGKGSLLRKMGSWYASDKFSTLRALYGWMWGWPGKKTLFMGNEWAPWDEWNYQKALDWFLLQKPEHAGIQRLIADLNRLYRTHPAWYASDMVPQGFYWINPNDAACSVFSFIRQKVQEHKLWGTTAPSPSITHTGKTSSKTKSFPSVPSTPPLLFIANFTPVERSHYPCGVPFGGTWREILNTDAASYGGSNRGNKTVFACPEPCDQQPYRLDLYLPPLSTLIFEYEGKQIFRKTSKNLDS